MICDFCGAKHLPVTKYKCTGISFGKKVKATVKMCITCDASTDQEWLADQLDWDGITEIMPKGGKSHD